MDRKFYVDLANAGLRMPIGADLVLKEKADHEERLLKGNLLGEVIVEAARRFKTPLGFPLMDLAVEREWMLLSMGIPAAEIGEYHFHGCPSEADLEKIKTGFAKATPRIKANCDAISYVRKNSDVIPVGMAIGPFSLMVKMISDPITAVYMSGMGVSAAEDDEVKLVENVLELATDAIINSIKHQIDAGAKAICLCEPAANTVYLSPIQLKDGSDIFDRYVLKYNKRIKKYLVERDVDLIFHDCGELLDMMLVKYNELDPAILSLGASRVLWEDAKIVSKNTVLFGNLPTKRFYSDADVPLSMVKEVSHALIKNMKDAGHPFILGSECDVLFVPGASGTIIEKINTMLTTRA